MTMTLPTLVVPRVADGWDAATDPFTWNWTQAATLPSFTLADGAKLATQQTVARVCYNNSGLFVHFDCADNDIWGTYTQRDEAIYDEEVVEVFIAPGATTPITYYEFEVSPNGVLLDVLAHNPTEDRTNITIDFAWDCPDLRWAAQRDDANNRWQAVLAMTWPSIGAPGDLPKVWRANFYRIERPRQGTDEYSCWSPTMIDPADFHRPSYFGYLELAA